MAELTGRRLLVIEDEPLVAEALEAAGATVVGMIGCVLPAAVQGGRCPV